MNAILRIILYPFSLLYGTVMAVRNVCFNIRLLKAKEYDIPIISIGNITVGGTGKTPHTEYVLRLLSEKRKLAVLSRGYGRKTKGYLEVLPDSIPDDCGDEPCQIKQKFPDITVVVCEDRREGIRQIQNKGNYDAIILDDAYQHRWVKPHYSILLVDYGRPIYDDFVMPAGRLREFSHGKKRADCIIVSKCPADISLEEKQRFSQHLSLKNKTLFFSTFDYAPMRSVFKNEEMGKIEGHLLLVTGIANPQPLEDYLRQLGHPTESLKFTDHHNFSTQDIKKIEKHYQTISSPNKWIITSEKDAVRLKQLDAIPVDLQAKMLYVPITVKLMENAEFFAKELNEQLNNKHESL